MAEDTKFTFSIARALDSQRDLRLRLEAEESRIQKFVNEVMLDEKPVISFILQLSHDSKELERLGHALVRVAEIIPTVDRLRSQIAMIDMVMEDPDRFQGMFGEFNDELDTFLGPYAEQFTSSLRKDDTRGNS
jgi:hypothetical protein